MDGYEFHPDEPQPKVRFGPYARVTISDPDPVHYREVKWDRNWILLQPTPGDAPAEAFPHALIQKLIEDKKVFVDPRHFDDAWQKARILNPDINSAGDLPGEVLDELEFYRRLILRVETMCDAKEASLSDASLRVAIPKAYGELVSQVMSRKDGEVGARKTAVVPKMPQPATFRRWRRRLIELRGDLVALRDGRSGRAVLRKPRIDDRETLAIMSARVREYLDSNRPTARGLHELMKGDFAKANATREAAGLKPLEVPSLSTFQRAIRKLDPFHVVLARRGPSEARRKFKLAARREGAFRAGDRVAIDNWKTHIMTLQLPQSFWEKVPADLRDEVGKARLHLCVAICEASKVILGVRLSLTATAEHAVKTLEMVCRDKTRIARAAGCETSWAHRLTPWSVCSDAGSEFNNAAFRAAVRDLGATDEIGPAKHPDVRPVIERFFRTIDVQLMQNFTGRTGSNVVDKGDYDPSKMASVTVEVLTKAIVCWIVDIYHNSPHGGLGGETPNDAWDRLEKAYGVIPAPQEEWMRSIFGLTIERRIGNRGLRFMGLHYRSKELLRIRMRVGQKPVVMRADFSDLGALSVRDPDDHAKWFTVPCEIDAAAGMTAREWIEAATDLRRKHADAARLREPVVLNAIARIKAMGLAAAEAAGIGPTTADSSDVEKAEKTVFRNFLISRPIPDYDDPEGLDDPEGFVVGPGTNAGVGSVVRSQAEGEWSDDGDAEDDFVL